MKKNGFIATSVLYSFFLIFLTLLVGLIAVYFQNRLLLNRLDTEAKKFLYGDEETKFEDMLTGDRIVFSTANEYILNNNAVWTLALKDNNTYYFVSDINAQKSSPVVKLSDDNIAKPHNLITSDGIDTSLYERIINENNIYQNSIGINSEVTMLTTTFLTNFKTKITDKYVLQKVYNINADYLIKDNSTYLKMKYYNIDNMYECIINEPNNYGYISTDYCVNTVSENTDNVRLLAKIQINNTLKAAYGNGSNENPYVYTGDE